MSAPPFCPKSFARKFPMHGPRWYVLGKLLADPLYPAVMEALHDSAEPLLDIGCGMGVLGFYLRDCGWKGACTGVDLDESKIRIARRIQHQWPGPFSFHAADAASGLPPHHGSVALLDVLQFMPPGAQQAVLHAAAARVSPGGMLIIRNAMAGAGHRHGITKAVDHFSRWCRWMGMRPREYPAATGIRDTLASQGLHGEFRPLWGRTPFHNWFGVFRHEPALSVGQGR